MKKITLGSRVIGTDEPCLIIAEAGVNHEGDVDKGKRLIDAARQAGADAIKFQSFQADKLVTEACELAPYQRQSSRAYKSQYAMLKDFELSRADVTDLYRYAAKNDILFLSTPFDYESLALLNELNIPAFKIGSGEITNLPFLARVARQGKPVILSTGAATLGEIEEAVGAIRTGGTDNLVLLHCVSSYPAKTHELNLRVIKTLEQAFRVPVGFSDHSRGINMAVAAVALGARVLEKHITLDTRYPGPDHKASLEPEEFEELVLAIRDVEGALGDGIKKPTPDEEEIKSVVRKSVVARVDIAANTILTEDMLELKRPNTGIQPKYLRSIIGKKVSCNVEKDQAITWDMVW